MRLLAATAIALLGLAAPALAETNVGVTAAVNQSAKGIVGSTVRTISLGDRVVFNERIQTGGEGLVQVLLADGTTFMVGPNSDLVIDSFVYDPNAGTAQVTASFTKGVLRFIGGQTSKTEGGVTLNTPVGTMGIRGAMVDVVLDPPNKGTPKHVDMLFGNEVTLQQGQKLLGRLYSAGYSLALGAGGKFDVVKTPPSWSSEIQTALAGSPGKTGGATKPPKDGDVKNSEVAKNNSGKNPSRAANTVPDMLSEKELADLLYAAAKYDELRELITGSGGDWQGFVGGILKEPCGISSCGVSTIVNEFVADTNEVYEVGLVTEYQATFTGVTFSQGGDPTSIEAYLQLPASGVRLLYRGDAVAGYLEATDDGSTLPQVGVSDARLYSYDGGHGLTVPQLNCTSCSDFMRWGFWGFTVPADQIEVVSGSGGTDLVYDAMWIAGDLTTASQLNAQTASATYVGDAVGMVNTGADTRVARGDMSMNWNFGFRSGVVEISDFDQSGYSWSYQIDPMTVGSPGFYSHDTSSGYGEVQGGFVNNGSYIAAGVAGSFTYLDDDYYASGVFMGARSGQNSLAPPTNP